MMVSQAQYDIYRSAFQEEEDRHVELINRSKIYLTLCTFFLGGLAFKLNESLKCADYSTKIPLLLSCLSFVVGFLCVILSMGIYQYEGVFDPQEELEKVGNNYPTDDEFREERIVDLAVATSRNCEINEKRAKHLQNASYAMLAGVISGFVGLFFLVM